MILYKLKVYKNMNNNSIVRQLNIDLITDEPNPLLNWFNSIWSQLNIIETDVYHNDGGELIYYKIFDNVEKMIFYQDNKNDIFWCSYDNYWSILENMLIRDYYIIHDITKLLVDNALNTVTTIIILYEQRYPIVGNALKKSLSSPNYIDMREYTK